MVVTSANYKFTQHFRVPAWKAYKWCTDYRPNDLALMGEKGRRGIQKLTQDTLILTEVVRLGRKTVRKRKLIKLNPAELAWYNIQLEGPNKHSTFLYQIQPEGPRASKLNFTGLMVVYSKRKLSPGRIRRTAGTERGYDSQAWVLLAKAMEKEV